MINGPPAAPPLSCLTVRARRELRLIVGTIAGCKVQDKPRDNPWSDGTLSCFSCVSSSFRILRRGCSIGSNPNVQRQLRVDLNSRSRETTPLQAVHPTVNTGSVGIVNRVDVNAHIGLGHPTVSPHASSHRTTVSDWNPP